MGLTEFSLPSSAILEIKRVFRSVTLAAVSPNCGDGDANANALTKLTPT